MPKVLGASLSPFVRKVRVVLAEKGVPYELVPVFPGSPDPAYRAKHPLGKIPCWEEDDGFTLPDSSAICLYLEKAHPTPPLFPSDARQCGRAAWLEEYADSALVSAVGVAFFQRVVQPMLKGQPDEGAVSKALETAVPEVFTYLESQIGDGPYLIGSQLSIADIAVASPIVNFEHAGEQIDADRFPKLAAFVQQIHARPSFKALIEEEKAMLPR